jgi:DNA (cytosine-5)-methyltransferase 1
VGLAWFSPDCRHFSKAKGKSLVSKKVRGLAWDAVRWARIVAPRVIILENVKEFLTWGPVGKDGKPVKGKEGVTFQRWLGCLKAAGYVVEWRVLRACDYGAPTIRERLFLVARRDGRKIVWPKPTHGKGRGLKPFKTAADCIDWTLPCHSIFLSKEEGKKLGVRRPLAPATLARVATGTVRFCVNNPKPFLVNTRNGERPGQDPRVRSVDQPYWTPTAQGSQGAVVTPIIVGIDNKSNGARDTWSAAEPLRTTTVENRFALCAAFLAQHNTDMVGHMPGKPMSTIVGKGCTQAPVIVKLKGTAKHGQDVRTPLHTVQAGGTHYALANAELADTFNLSADDLAKGHRVYAFLVKYYKSGTSNMARLDRPMPTVRTKDGLGLVLVHVGGGEYGVIIDICMRMLKPHELFAAQGFPASYQIDRMHNGRRLTGTEKVRMCGNSVCPPMAEAIVRANFKHESEYEALAA